MPGPIPAAAMTASYSGRSCPSWSSDQSWGRLPQSSRCASAVPVSCWTGIEPSWIVTTITMARWRRRV